MVSSDVEPENGDDPSETPPPSENNDDFNAAIESGSEMEVSEPDASTQAPVPAPRPTYEDQVPGVKFLASLLKATIFTDLFVYHADLRFAHPTKQERVDALHEAHPVFYKLCRNSDYVVRIALVAITVGLAGTAAWGTIHRLFYA